MSLVFEINKGVNKAIEFRGIKAQYITFLAIGLVGLLILFAVCYFIGIPTYFTLLLVLVLGFFLFSWVSNVSRKYGEYGLMKQAAYKRVPVAIVCRSRKTFIGLNKREVKDDSRDNDRTSRTGRSYSSVKGK
ncbi:DUF4133 domain-containing protein [Niastella sp. OAS944]|uniref:DUF4133 domain-containing protein n=1 Tax=Niastella sp. OAS944 TaxID=2664089 RepID=UPI003482E73B|nr:O-antigen/teichoic acid export membrane protein [Chitinophagaceae bacterium OAS944]